MKRINELFDSPVKWKSVGGNRYEFNIEDSDPNVVGDTVYTVAFTGKNKVIVEFYIAAHPDSHGLLKTGNSIKVFSTVVDIIKQHVKNNKVKVLTFDAKGHSRQKLYSAMVKKLSKDFTVEIQNGRNTKEYILTKK